MRDYFGAPIRKLGFGFMRLPEKLGGEIDIVQVKEMVDLYMEHGFSYFDTAFVYAGGKSEEAIRKAVSERYPRDKFQATTKLPLWGPLSFEQMKERTQTSLDRMGLQFLDLYLLHGIGPNRLEMIDKMKAWDYMLGLRDSGKAKNIGFSFHGDGDTLNRILDVHAKDLDIVQLQINYLDWEDEDVQSKKCYEAALAHGMGIIIMEPVKGGLLANFTPSVAEVLRKANPSVSFASWALRYALNLDGIITVLSGMSSLEQVEDNIKTTETMGPLTEAETRVIAEVLEELEKVPTIPCTDCRYCVDDCPKKINTPRIIELINNNTKHENLDDSRAMYGRVTSGLGPFGNGVAAKSSDCIECGVCEEHCPQKINIIEAHKEAARLFE